MVRRNSPRTLTNSDAREAHAAFLAAAAQGIAEVQLTVPAAAAATAMEKKKMRKPK